MATDTWGGTSATTWTTSTSTACDVYYYATPTYTTTTSTTTTFATSDWHYTDNGHARMIYDVGHDTWWADGVEVAPIEVNEAEEKALKLLGEIIGEDQLEVYSKTGRLFVKGKDGDYIARNGRSLQKIEGNKVVDLCVHIESRLNCPPTDTVIGLKFLLENEPENVIRIANKLGESKLEEIPLAACM